MEILSSALKRAIIELLMANRTLYDSINRISHMANTISKHLMRTKRTTLHGATAAFK